MPLFSSNSLAFCLILVFFTPLFPVILRGISSSFFDLLCHFLISVSPFIFLHLLVILVPLSLSFLCLLTLSFVAIPSHSLLFHFRHFFDLFIIPPISLSFPLLSFRHSSDLTVIPFTLFVIPSTLFVIPALSSSFPRRRESRNKKILRVSSRKNNKRV